MEIIKENGKVKAKVVIDDRYGDEMLTMRNGWQWTGFPINENLAFQMIDALNEYLTVLKEKRDEDEEHEDWGDNSEGETGYSGECA